MSGSNFNFPEASLVALFCEASVHGAYTILYVASVYLLAVRGRRRTTSVQAKAMLFLGTLQWMLSTSHVLLALSNDIVAFIYEDAAAPGSQSSFNNQATPVVVAQLAIEAANCIIADSILIWRAWIIWSHNVKPLIPSILLLIATAGASVSMVYEFAVAPEGDSIWTAPGITTFTYVFAALTLTTNVTVTSMIIGRVLWQSRRISRALGYPVGGGSYQSVVILLAESGAIYSLSWIIAILVGISGSNWASVLADIIAQLTGMMPTLIVVLVCLGMTHGEGAAMTDTVQSARISGEGSRNRPSVRRRAAVWSETDELDESNRSMDPMRATVVRIDGVFSTDGGSEGKMEEALEHVLEPAQEHGLGYST